MIKNNHELLKYINKDLRIRRYKEEEIIQYIARIVYSALGIWIRISALDEDIFENNPEFSGVSKIHIINRCSIFLDNIIEIYPEIEKWFKPYDSEENPIITIRDRLYKGGELVDVGFNTNLALPTYKECVVNDGISIIRGLNVGNIKISTGLAQLKKATEENTRDIEKIFKFYGLKSKSAKEEVMSYVKNIKWNKIDYYSAEIFNKYSKECFSSCWNSEYKLESGEITLYRHEFYDFGFIKKLDDNIYISQISKYLIDQFEVRRFMYGLKNDVNNSANATYKMEYEKGIVRLNLYNKLPEKEEGILLLLGWPMKDINDKLNLIFHISIWPVVEVILKNLNIDLQEVM
ncbi:hypothetical protein [Hathewaya massiliensis]|uniref:hypothetical protein n=1 Tax=Hathewaya massiliensis TaxID=1964382 RepID=UPI0011579815|nr:hypothetical protein [Hathewaya massiliensis]